MKELYPVGHLSPKQKKIKEACETSFYTFVRVVRPDLVLGHVHEDTCKWIQLRHDTAIAEREARQGSLRLLVLLPRGHLKSTLIALYTAWCVIRQPWITILYASASGDLAERQLYAITNILIGPDVRYYWRGLIKPKKAERDQWRAKSINVDHWSRNERGVRDNTIRAMSVGATITGDHYDLTILDDIIAPNSDADPWSVAGRQMVDRWYAQLASVMNPGSVLIAVGTRYHKQDVYSKMMEAERCVYNESGEIIERYRLFQVMTEVAETNGQFLWPRTRSDIGDWYGYNEEVLGEIRETYRKAGEMEQFFAQYYQNPSDKENPKMAGGFSYYDKEDLVYKNGRWYLRVNNGTELVVLNFFAAIDIAYSVSRKADFTAIIVVGCDPNNYRYVIDIDRFRTTDPYVMMDHLFGMHEKWSFVKCRIETTAAQALFASLVKTAQRERNQNFIIDEFKPQVKKEERIMAAISPLIQMQQLFFFRGGLCEELEKQLVEQKPEHDDIADVLAAVQEIIFRPAGVKKKKPKILVTNARFGGVAEVRTA